MKTLKDTSPADICVAEVSIVSGIRPAGRTTDHMQLGRPHHGFLYVFRGEAQFYTKGKRCVSVRDGELLFIPRGLRYKMQYTAKSTVFVLVNFEVFERGGEALTLFDTLTAVARDGASLQIAGIMTKLELVGAAQGLHGELRKKELLFRLLSMVYGAENPLSSGLGRYPQIASGVLLLKQTYLENLPVEEFARASHISVSSFRDLFRREYGTSPVAYRNRLRIRRAQELLSEGSCTVAEAAYACGFENVGYFCRCYKSITGERPSLAKQ